MPLADVGPEYRVWCRETAPLDAAALAAATALLSPDERERAARFRLDRDRRDYIAAHALTRERLAACVGRPPSALRFAAGAHGKPILLEDDGRPSAWTFSLSHTHGLVAVVIAFGTAVGIDVETLDRDVDVDLVAAHWFAPAEVARLRRAAAPQRHRAFLELWTLKEALAKAIGVGLTLPLQEIAFDLSADAIRVDVPPGVDTRRWRFELRSPTPAHVLAIANGRDQPLSAD